jgi:hypothetical protein
MRHLWHITCCHEFQEQARKIREIRAIRGEKFPSREIILHWIIWKRKPLTTTATTGHYEKP